MAKPEIQQPVFWSASEDVPASPWDRSPLGFVYTVAEMEELGQVP